MAVNRETGRLFQGSLKGHENRLVSPRNTEGAGGKLTLPPQVGK